MVLEKERSFTGDIPDEIAKNAFEAFEEGFSLGVRYAEQIYGGKDE